MDENSVNSKKPTPFIFQSKDGSWSITHGVVFCEQFFFAEAGSELPAMNSVSNVRVFTRLPHWWQVFKWWRLIQMLKRCTSSPSECAIEMETRSGQVAFDVRMDA